MRSLSLLVIALLLGLLPIQEQRRVTQSAAPEPLRVLVVGATGQIGKHAVTELLARGQSVRALTRHPEEARRLEPRVEWVAGDLRVASSLEAVCKDMDALIFAAGSRTYEDPSNTPERIYATGVESLCRLAQRDGVQHLVLISSSGVTQELPGASEYLKEVLRAKFKGEQALRRSGLAYTILRPIGMGDMPGGQLGVALLQGDTIRASVTISRQDLALVAVESLFLPAARFKTVELFNAATQRLDSWKTDLARLEADAE